MLSRALQPRGGSTEVTMEKVNLLLQMHPDKSMSLPLTTIRLAADSKPERRDMSSFPVFPLP